MIVSLAGTVAGWSETDRLHLLVGGVGYEITMAVAHEEAMRRAKVTQEPVFIWTHLAIRDDAHQLFGFLSVEEKQVFLNLLKVNGVGPRMAMNLLSGGQPQEIIRLIDAGDVKKLSQFPKVGKKTAEQIILKLKGQLVFAEERSSQAKIQAGVPLTHPEIRFALTHLGFRAAEVEQVIEQLPAEIATEEGIRRGLQLLSQRIV